MGKLGFTKAVPHSGLLDPQSFGLEGFVYPCLTTLIATPIFSINLGDEKRREVVQLFETKIPNVFACICNNNSQVQHGNNSDKSM